MTVLFSLLVAVCIIGTITAIMMAIWEKFEMMRIRIREAKNK